MEDKEILRKSGVLRSDMRFKFSSVILIGWLFITESWRIASGSEFTDFGSYRGKVVDAGTKKPIERIVVFIEWRQKHAFGGSTFYDAQETLTDYRGERKRFTSPGTSDIPREKKKLLMAGDKQ